MMWEEMVNSSFLMVNACCWEGKCQTLTFNSTCQFCSFVLHTATHPTHYPFPFPQFLSLLVCCRPPHIHYIYLSLKFSTHLFSYSITLHKDCLCHNACAHLSKLNWRYQFALVGCVSPFSCKSFSVESNYLKPTLEIVCLTNSFSKQLTVALPYCDHMRTLVRY